MYLKSIARKFPLTGAILLLTLLALPAVAGAAARRVIDDSDRVVLRGNVPVQALPQDDIGPSSLDLPMNRMILVLARRPGADARLARLIEKQHDPSSPLFHRWLTPAQFGQRFGVSDEDLNAVLDWLQGNGFTIDEIANGRGWIDFSGTAGQVERAFHTQMHDFYVDGKVRHANIADPSIPRGLSDIVLGVATLHNFPKQPANTGFRPIKPDELSPEYTSGSSHYLAPPDFATIYDVNPLYGAGVNGSGATIAIVGRTDINLSDVSSFRSQFGLPANAPTIVHNGTDPGDLGGGEEGEADLDVEWSGAVAPSATVKFVVSASTSSTDGVDLSAQYIVNNNVGDVMSTSFGQCESSMGTTENQFYSNTWSQAVAQGITPFVSAGDSGAAGCNAGSDTTGSGQAVSGLCSTPYNVCVGGTEFNDTASPSTYWGSSNSSAGESALSYIPESAWNESGSVSGGSGLWATGGGVSTVYAKPSWQAGVGVPADGKRDVPDVALTAASHDGYLVEQGGSLSVVGGTSASSPSWAGLMALVVQKTGARQGNANTVLYSMANNQYGSGGTAVFHDTTSGNNSVPGVTGFSCTTGYDRATGVGTADAAALVNNWGGAAPTPDFAISASPASVSVVQGSSGSSTVSTTVSGGFNNAVSLTASGAPLGVTVSFAPSSIAAPGSGSSTMTMAVSSSAAAGTYAITVTGSGGSKSHTATVSLTVTTSGGTTVVTNGGFETGSFSGWTTSGVAAVNTSAKHSGSYGAMLGSTSPSTDSSAVQTFTLPSGSPTLSFWYSNTCPDTVTYDWATATLKDNATGTTTTLLAKTCASSAAWTQVSYNASGSAGHSVTLTLSNHDDNYAGDPTYTYYDDVAVSGGGGSGDTTPPTTSITSPSNGATVSGTVSVTASASDNVGVTKVEFYIDGALKATDTASPYTYSWDTTAVANGTHSIFTKAYDAAGNVGTSSTVSVTVSNTVTSQQLLGNPGFENGSTNPAPWVPTAGVIDNSTSEPAHTGSWKAWLDGYGTTHTDTLYQQVAIPSSITKATLTFWLHIDTAETTTTSAYDTLKVQVQNSSGTVLATLATYSNLNAASGYTQKSFDLTAYKGQTIRVYLNGTEDSSLQTSFVVDDFALNTQ